MQLRYLSHDEYCNITVPLLTLEIWAGIARDYETDLKEKKTKQCVYYGKQTLTEARLESLVSRKNFDAKAYPRCGDLVSLTHTQNIIVANRSDDNEIFGYIISVAEEYIGETTIVDYKLKQVIKEPYMVLKYIFLTKRMALQSIGSNHIHKLTKITYLRSSLRPLHALAELPKSPLLSCILHPLADNLQLPVANDITLATKENLNAKQLETVSRITKAVSQSSPKICLIHGPPGTGKSRVIVNLVTELLYGNDTKFIESNKKILVCAPSNTATDEIVLRLIKIQRKFLRSFKIIRMGAVESMHQEVQKVCLSEVARNNESLWNDEAISGKEQWIAETQALSSTNVIASTLSSSYTDRMASAFT